MSSARLPRGGKPGEALDFILTALGYADGTYGVAAGQHTVKPLLECTHEWLQTTGQDVNPKKSVSFIIPDSDHEIQMRGVSFPKETEFRSLGAGVRTTDSVASGPLILKRIGKACALLDRIHGVQGDFDDRCKVVATMVNATGLHASEIVAISQKDITPFETWILKAMWGPPDQAERRKFFLPHVLGTQNCPLPAGTLLPRRLAGKALQNTWPSHDHGTSRMGRESPHTQVGTVWSGAENPTRLGMASALGLVGMEIAGCYRRSATDG